MLILLHDGRKLDFLGNFDGVWMDLYLVSEVFANNSV